MQSHARGQSLSKHNLVDVVNHPVSGLTAGHVLRATGATTYAFGATLWADVDKTTSSLADLATRSAGDLNAGNLPWARLPTGAGTWYLSGDSVIQGPAGGTTLTQSSRSVGTPGGTGIQISDGSVFIARSEDLGTLIPTAKLEVRGNSVVGNGIWQDIVNDATYVTQLRLLGGGKGDGMVMVYNRSEHYSQITTRSNGSTAVRITIRNDDGCVGIATTSPTLTGTGKLHMFSDTFRLDTTRTPASAGAAGNPGEFCWDANYLYLCTATNTWRRIAHATW